MSIQIVGRCSVLPFKQFAHCTICKKEIWFSDEVPDKCPYCGSTHSRPDWDSFLLGLARAVSKRSHDAQTAHGCVIVDARRRILAVGYNGLPHGLREDWKLPVTRPEKYPWMLHAEVNALANAPGPVEGGTAYVTGKSCFHCLLLLWQHGVKKVVQAEAPGWQFDAAEEALKKEFFSQSTMEVSDVKPDLSWIADLVLADKELREEVLSRVRLEVRP